MKILITGGDNLIIGGCVKSRIYSALSELGNALLELNKLYLTLRRSPSIFHNF